VVAGGAAAADEGAAGAGAAGGDGAEARVSGTFRTVPGWMGRVPSEGWTALKTVSGAVLAHADAVPVAAADDPELRRRRGGGPEPACAQPEGEHEAAASTANEASLASRAPATAFANPRRVGATALGLEQTR
jgi:hypothetical protein